MGGLFLFSVYAEAVVATGVALFALRGWDRQARAAVTHRERERAWRKTARANRRQAIALEREVRARVADILTLSDKIIETGHSRSARAQAERDRIAARAAELRGEPIPEPAPAASGK